MINPLSKPVLPGETTLASQYNNLRQDALFLSGNEAESASLRQILTGMEPKIRLKSETAVITLDASEAQTCALMFGGSSGIITEPILLTLSTQAFPSTGQFWLFAQKTPGEKGFKLMAQSNFTEVSDTRLIGSFIWDAETENVRQLRTLETNRVQRSLPSAVVCEGRLTAASGNPFPVSDIAAATTLYFTPCFGNRISLWNACSGWEMFFFEQLSCPLSGLSAACCYDAFVQLDAAGKPSLTLEPWSNLTLRAKMVSWFQGVLTLSAETSRRYVGTIGLSAVGTTRDTLTERLVWNLYNRVNKPLRKRCAVAQNSNPQAGVWVPYAQDQALAVTLVTGQSFAEVELTGIGAISTMASSASALGIGVDVDLTDLSSISNAADLSALEYTAGSLMTKLTNRVPNRLLGKHTCQLISYTLNDTHTFNGTNFPQNQIGLTGHVEG